MDFKRFVSLLEIVLGVVVIIYSLSIHTSSVVGDYTSETTANAVISLARISALLGLGFIFRGCVNLKKN